MSKVFRIFLSLFFLSFPFHLYASEKSTDEFWNSFLEWSGHPILAEESTIRSLTTEYIQSLRKESEQSIEFLLKNDLNPKNQQKTKFDKLKKDLQSLELFAGVQIQFPGKNWETVFFEGETFPDSYYEFESNSVKIRYLFANLPYRPLPAWGELKLQGNFLLYSGSGALLLYKTNPGFPLKDLDIREIRTFYEENKKHGGNVKNFSEKGTELFYFPNHNLTPFYILLLSKIGLIFISFIILILYTGKFWSFLSEQTRRSRKAEASFLEDKEKVENEFLTD
ncbi:hypothetical protein [Leptospira sarikeiensis]|uniref:Uncharacterized protein n=1 Tax=Leptospira sarikeiensis TaxID=2484943 RepID=A0A4V3JRD2_9LEPT|nr:hypothetical protein [Leptospira sarikeiensis]TGL59545.1 hypothetical protein EHQ64_15755 [Leptospira sarikeiensis]